jgi:Uma2 family endonuclease
MGSTTQGLILADAMALPEDPLEEIVHGEIRKKPPRGRGHAVLIDRLYRMLAAQLPEDSYRILTTAYGLGIRHEPLAVRVPDLTVFAEADFAASADDRAYVWVAPKLVVECLSPSNRKGSVHQLLADYEIAQVAEVWLLHPQTRAAERHVLQGGLYGPKESFEEDEFRAASVPAQVSLARLWDAFAKG